ncbi:MAG: hypothetical protein WCH65_05295 [bacterium]
MKNTAFTVAEVLSRPLSDQNIYNYATISSQENGYALVTIESENREISMEVEVNTKEGTISTRKRRRIGMNDYIPTLTSYFGEPKEE